MTIEVDGADTLARTLADAADKLGDLTSLHQELGDIIIAAAGPLTPVLTGHLRANHTAIASSSETTITNPVRYAPFVHARVAYLTGAATATEATQLAAADRHIQSILDTVKGA